MNTALAGQGRGSAREPKSPAGCRRMTTETATPEKALADVRKEIDAIDDAIQDLLLKRTELVVEVAEAKARAASAAGKAADFLLALAPEAA